MEKVDSVSADAGNGGGSFWHAAVGGLNVSAVGKSSSKLSFPVKLGAGLASLAPVRVSAD